MRKNKGFTLVEILIVVVILGILAAIVIPQFSDASTQSKVSSSLSSLQSLRGQVSLYKIQHNDNAPGIGVFEEAMTLCSAANATDAADYAARTAANTGTHPFGPYVQSVPANPWNGSRDVAAAAAAGNGWIYDDVTGNIFLDVSDVTNADALTTMRDAGAVHSTQMGG
jgi:general secretion pathway protein G